MREGGYDSLYISRVDCLQTDIRLSMTVLKVYITWKSRKDIILLAAVLSDVENFLPR